MEMIEVDWNDLTGVTTVRIPGWSGECRVEARTDGEPGLRIMAPQRYVGERWHLVLLRGGVLCPVIFSDLSGPPQRQLQDGALPPLVVRVPPDRVDSITVDTTSRSRRKQ